MHLIAPRTSPHLVAFDRAGYGESDPNPGRNVKSEALDIEELADKLDLGEKFYVLGVSMGGYSVWGCLQYIPHRLAGAALVVPVINYWWPSFPAEVSRQAFKKLIVPVYQSRGHFGSHTMRLTCCTCG